MCEIIFSLVFIDFSALRLFVCSTFELFVVFSREFLFQLIFFFFFCFVNVICMNWEIDKQLPFYKINISFLQIFSRCCWRFFFFFSSSPQNYKKTPTIQLLFGWYATFKKNYQQQHEENMQFENNFADLIKYLSVIIFIWRKKQNNTMSWNCDKNKFCLLKQFISNDYIWALFDQFNTLHYSQFWVDVWLNRCVKLK